MKAAVKTALVTGGASGIGRAIADRLRADGNHVATIDLHRSDTDFSYVADVTDRGAGRRGGRRGPQHARARSRCSSTPRA